MEKPDVLSLVVKSTLFNKDHSDDLHNLIERVLSPDYLYFGISNEHEFIQEVRKANSLM